MFLLVNYHDLNKFPATNNFCTTYIFNHMVVDALFQQMVTHTTELSCETRLTIEKNLMV